MGFKLDGAPYNKDNMNIGVYRRDLKDGSAGKSNHTGIIVDKDVSKEMEDAVIAHETVHQHQQRNGELDYDDNNFYWKGKTYPRKNLNEHNENLPWEKEAYAVSNKMLNGKDENMKEKFKLKGYRGNNKPFKTLSDRGLIGAQDGAAAAMCTPDGGGGDECKAFKDKKLDKKVRVKRKKKPKTTKHRGTLEKKNYIQTETIPGQSVAVSQVESSGKTTGWRHSDDYNNVKDFKDDVNKTNLFDSNIADKAAKQIKPSVTKQTLRQDELTRRNKKGKAKMYVKRTGYGEKGERATMRNPDALVTRKDRLIGKDKYRSYTTNEAHASKQNKLVTKKKMQKLSAKATKQLTKGSPKKVKAQKPKKSSKSTSIYM